MRIFLNDGMGSGYDRHIKVTQLYDYLVLSLKTILVLSNMSRLRCINESDDTKISFTLKFIIYGKFNRGLLLRF